MKPIGRVVTVVLLTLVGVASRVETPIAAPSARISVGGVQLGMRRVQVDNLLGIPHLLGDREGSLPGGYSRQNGASDRGTEFA